MSFKKLGLSDPILRSLKELHHFEPSKIQKQAIPIVLSGNNLMAAAQTGTGKTGSFVLPIIEYLLDKPKPFKKHVHALILTPTRELAAQVRESIYTYGKFTSTTSAAVFGGVKVFPQKSKLKKGLDVLVATPGRLLDLHNQKAVKLSRVKVLVLDEADHMLDMGFINDIKKIIALTPEDRQNLLFSATFSNEIRKLAKTLGSDLREITAQNPNSTVAAIKQVVYCVDKDKKSQLLAHLINSGSWHQVLVFSRTKHGCEKIAKKLNAVDIKTLTIHGDKRQGARTKALKDFKEKKVKVLVATDVAARGIDINNLPYVINFDMPTYPNDYIHRIGRTGRAGKNGNAISFMDINEKKFLNGVENLLKNKIQQITEAGFEPVQKPSTESRSKASKDNQTKFKKSKKNNLRGNKYKKSLNQTKQDAKRKKKRKSKARTRWKKVK
ncbi:MAG: DEAD/DEAH box helicase [Gammaproteobacteria bacterium]